MTTPTLRDLVSLTAALIMTVALGGCATAPARPAPVDLSTVETARPSIRFDNQAREQVQVYLIGERREWLLGRVEPGATAALRIPTGAVEGGSEFVQLAVLTGSRSTQQAAHDRRALVSIAQPASTLAAQQWRYAQGQLSQLALHRP